MLLRRAKEKEALSSAPSKRLIARVAGTEICPVQGLVSMDVALHTALRQILQTSTSGRRNELFSGGDTLLKSTDPDNKRDVCVMKANDTSGNFPPN